MGSRGGAENVHEIVTTGDDPSGECRATSRRVSFCDTKVRKDGDKGKDGDEGGRPIKGHPLIITAQTCSQKST